MTTPTTVEERVTILETRLDTILPTLATKDDIARLEGKMETMNERLESKIEGMGNRLLIRFGGLAVAVATVAVAAAKYL